MIIEIYTPDKAVKEWIVAYIRNAILKLHKQDAEILRAEVCFKERRKQVTSEKICEINLSIFKDSTKVTGSGKSLETAARKVIEELTRTIALNYRVNNEVPDQMVSTVAI